MEYYAGIDVSLKESSVCVVDATGKLVREVKVGSEPECLVGYFDQLDFPVERIGLEAGPLSQWLHAALVAAGHEVVLLETRHVKAALSAMTVKTDRKDARGIAQPLRMGWYRPVHAKLSPAQDTRALLVGRKLLQSKLLYVELSIRGILRGYGLKVGEVSRGRFEARIRELIAGHAILSMVIDAMLTARAALWSEFTKLHREMLRIARADRVCQRLMSAPGVGALVALTYRSAVDDPARFEKSSTVGAYFGLTPKKYQSGETDRDGGVSKVGDAMVRTALFESAHIMLTRATRFSSLKRWALDVARRRGMKRAKVALARKLGVVLHRMWMDATDFRWSANPMAA
ncbi:IS110 family transposase [Rhizobium gallicum]|uniref:IS110 family transposase n=1 Tax=Rhizobium gallicum TaxID=56730 RepID=UPI00093AD8C8|nr:IS110 family transposase [Rhizobium gallicum]